MDRTLGQLLAEAMERHGHKTQDEAAAAMGTSQANVQRWVKDQSLPKAEHFQTLMNYLDVDIDRLGAAIARSDLRRLRRSQQR